MKFYKNISPCVNSLYKTNSSSRSYKNGKLVSGYDITYDSGSDSDSDDGLEIKTYGDIENIPTRALLKGLLHNSLYTRLKNDFDVSVSPGDLYDFKKIGSSVSPLLSQKYHPVFNSDGASASKNKSPKKTKQKSKGRGKGKGKKKTKKNK